MPIPERVAGMNRGELLLTVSEAFEHIEEARKELAARDAEIARLLALVSILRARCDKLLRSLTERNAELSEAERLIEECREDANV